VIGLVLDASVTLAWCFRDEATAETEAVLDQLLKNFAVVPVVWPLELANILTAAERNRRITAATTAEFASRLQTLDIRIDEAWGLRSLTDHVAFVRSSGLTSYDAAYLELAMRSGLSLATRDRALATAARRNGVAVIRC
jgi:predicted nucleic acid-binding protein